MELMQGEKSRKIPEKIRKRITAGRWKENAVRCFGRRNRRGGSLDISKRKARFAKVREGGEDRDRTLFLLWHMQGGGKARRGVTLQKIVPGIEY